LLHPQLSVEVVSVLRDRTTTIQAVPGLYLVTIAIGVEEPHLAIGVDMDPRANPDHVIPELIGSIKGKIPAGQCVDFLSMTSNGEVPEQIRTQGV